MGEMVAAPIFRGPDLLLMLPAAKDNSATNEEFKRHRFQFSLRSLLIVTLICAVPCAWLSWRLKRAERERGILSSLTQLGGAFQSFHNAHGAMPPAAIFSRDGKPLLSWRVAILPFLGETALYEQFELDEPWDSEHNLKLLAKMPRVYLPLRGPTPKEPYSTYYQVFTGRDAPFSLSAGVVVGKDLRFEGTPGPKYSDFSDGTAQTFLIVESAEAVPWTKPADLAYDADKPLPHLGFDDRFYLVLADGSAHFIKMTIPESVIRGGVTPHGHPVPGAGREMNEGSGPREPILISDQ